MATKINQKLKRREDRLKNKPPKKNSMSLSAWQNLQRELAEQRRAYLAYEKVLRDMERYAKERAKEKAKVEVREGVSPDGV